MNVQSHSASPEEDLDSTAELPVLDVAALEARAAEEQRNGSTDTWIIPPPTLRVASEVPDASTAESRNELETNLRAVSANLADLEERLKRKVEQLSQNELALEAERARRAAAEQRAAELAQHLADARAGETAAQRTIADLHTSLQERTTVLDALRAKEQEASARTFERERQMAELRNDLAESRARASDYFESLQSQEGQRSLFHNLFSGLQSDVDAAESHAASMRIELAAQTARERDLRSDLDERVRRIENLEQQINTFAVSLAQRDSQLLDERNLSEKLRRDLKSLEARLAAEAETAHQTERSRAAEEREELLTRITAHEVALTVANSAREELEKAASVAQAKASEQEATLVTQRRRIEQLENEITVVRNEMEEWGAAVRQAAAERSEHAAALVGREERIKELAARVAEQQETVRTLQAEAIQSAARAKEVEADLRVAEEAIHRLESDLRNKGARVDELERTNHEWHAMVDEARTALTERDSLIQRLEEEATNSAVLIGQIQQSMRRLDPSNSGPHEAMPEGATRLLIRTDGDTEVVHVLGRKTSIGRTPDNDLQIDAKFISRHHAVILAGPARTIVEDLNSTNGVLVNGRRITRQVLADGDAVTIGRTQFRFALRTPADRR
jgi:chromosome segregation ATPase